MVIARTADGLGVPSSPDSLYGLGSAVDARFLGLWVDTDIALGAGRGDVDDGFALAAVVSAIGRNNTQRIRLVGISAVAGNTDARTAASCAERLLGAAGCAVPVTRAEDAARKIAALPAGSVLLCLGPLTHVAAALRLDPTLADRIELRAVTGVQRPLRYPWLLAFDLNRKADRPAAKTVLESPMRRRLYPLDVVQRLRFGPAELARIGATGPLGEHLARGAARWARQSWIRYASPRFPVWDLVAALDTIGKLPGAQVQGDRLTTFDPDPGFASFLKLLQQPVAP